MYSDMLYFWHSNELIVNPTNPWEYVQIGNCGPATLQRLLPLKSLSYWQR